MPQVITPQLLEAMFQGFNVLFNQARLGVEPSWSKVAMKVPSSGSAENYGWLGQVPRIREWVGDRVYKSLDAYGYAIRNKTFESTFTIKREQIEDDEYGLIGNVASTDMGRSVALFPDELIYGLAKAGFTSNCYDGQYFFDSDHPVRDENGVIQTFSNVQSGSNPAWFLLDTTKAIKPFIYQSRREFAFISKTDPRTSDRVFDRNEYVYGVDGRCNAGYGLWQTAFGSKDTLNRTNFRAAYNAMINFKLDEFRPAGVKPNLLVVGASNWQKARDIIETRFLTEAGASGPVENSDYKIVEIMLVPWLD